MPTQALVSVPALCAFMHEGRSYVRGDVVTVSPVTASQLARVGKVTLDRQAAVRAVRASEARYRTQDVQAEAPSVRTRRHYRRRDMQAESE